MGDRIKALTALAALLIVLTGCTSAIKGTGRSGISSSADCAAVLMFRGQSYRGTSLRTHPPYTRVARITAAHMHLIGSGEFPPCQDTGPTADATAQPVQVASIDGVDPGTAVAVLPHGDVFVRQLTPAVIQSVLTTARGIRWDYSS